ncbi:MAG TPA: DHA2 family efflux MFS transporter permease subunit [Spirochaetia bacterium]|nr:DHA2 family efflux MFS transporter permease subunit [Spirochaetia bacterium]
MALTSVAFFMVTLDTLIVVTALPSIHRDLGASLASLAWTINAYALAAAAGIVSAAALGDRLGRRPVFAFGLGLFTFASVAGALAPSVDLLIAARALQGLAAAIVMPLSLTILTGAFPAEKRGTIVGIWGGIAGLAVAAGPLMGGLIIQGLDWHWIFWLNVPVGVVTVAFSLKRIPSTRGIAARLDAPAALLSAGASFAIVWGLVRGNQAGWGSAEILAALGSGAALLAALVAWERRASNPMLPPRLFRSRGFTAANATSFLNAAALTSAAFFIAQYFQMARGDSPVAAGLHMLTWTATPIVVAPLAGRLSDKVGRRRIMVTGMILQALGVAWLALLGTVGVAYSALVLPSFIAGVGVSMVLPTAPTAALSSVPLSDIGKASGVNSTLQRFGSAFGVAMTAAVFSATGHLGSAISFDAGFRPALALAAVFSAVGALAALAAAGKPARQLAPEAAAASAGA